MHSRQEQKGCQVAERDGHSARNPGLKSQCQQIPPLLSIHFIKFVSTF